MTKRFWQVVQAIVIAIWAVYAGLFLALAIYVSDPVEPLIWDIPAILLVLGCAAVGSLGLRVMHWLDTKIDGDNNKPVRWPRDG